MAFCNTCGTDNGDAKYCPQCGAPQPGANTQTISDPFVGTETTNQAVGQSFDSGNVVQAGGYTAPDFSSGSPVTRPSNTGQIVFSIINIVLGVILCCCGYGLPFISCILGIVAVVMASRASGAPTEEDARNSLRTAKILNIIGVVLLGVGVLIFSFVVMTGGTALWQEVLDELERQGYSYTLMNFISLIK